MSLNGIIHCDIVEGAFDTELFYTFISCLMEPFPAPNSVIVMDGRSYVLFIDQLAVLFAV